MDVILKVKGIKKEEIVKVEYINQQIVLYTETKKFYYTIEKIKGSYIITGEEPILVEYECKPMD